MPVPSEGVLPVRLSSGWPDAVPGCAVTIRETGITLGALILEDDEWRTLRSSPLFSLRIDDHEATYGWTTRHPEGPESHVEFEIPLVRVVPPPDALTSTRAFTEWVLDAHGANGRLLLWDESRRWWIVHEPDLELAVICAPRGMFSEESDRLSWLSFGTAEGRQMVERLRARYGMSDEK